MPEQAGGGVNVVVRGAYRIDEKVGEVEVKMVVAARIVRRPSLVFVLAFHTDIADLTDARDWQRMLGLQIVVVVVVVVMWLGTARNMNKTGKATKP